MFIERGFQQVRVSEIAAACDVSEKTVFNYFPTKESLLFDRGDAIADALSASLSGSGAVLEAFLQPLIADLDRLTAGEGDNAGNDAETDALDFINRFNALLDATPSLRAAAADLFDRLAQLAAQALGRATATSANSPANQIAAIALVGLWRVQLDAMRRHAALGRSVDQVRLAVLHDLECATEVVKKIL